VSEWSEWEGRRGSCARKGELMEQYCYEHLPYQLPRTST
jgi:hypothetical protein